jgi:hypothetical protein
MKKPCQRENRHTSQEGISAGGQRHKDQAADGSYLQHGHADSALAHLLCKLARQRFFARVEAEVTAHATV